MGAGILFTNHKASKKKCAKCGNTFIGLPKRTVCNDCKTGISRPCVEIEVKTYQDYLSEYNKQIPLKQHIKLRDNS